MTELKQKTYAVAYARVSTDDHDQNPESQLVAIRKWAKAKDVTILQEFQDEKTGTNTYRDGLSDVLGYLTLNDINRTPGKITMLVVLDADRFSRNIKDTAKLLDVLDRLGVKLTYTVQDSLDVTTPEGYVINTIKSYGAESFTRGHRDKIMAGLERAKKEGKELGRPLKRSNDIKSDTILYMIEHGYSLRQLEKIYNCSRMTLVRRIEKDGKKEQYQKLVESRKKSGIEPKPDF